MESNKLAVLDKKLPLRAYPENQLDEVLKTSFKFWLATLLSIKAENEDKLDAALPAIKKHFWSLGIVEVKKAFEMYADGELTIKPIPNYFDRILVGQIFNEYRDRKPRPKVDIKPIEISQDEKDLIVYSGLICCFDNWVQTNNIIDGQIWAHDHLMELGLLKFSDLEKKAMWDLSKKNLNKEAKSLDYNSAKEVLRKLESKTSGIREIEYKKLRVKHYFSKIHAKKEHLKKFL
jgi:hypothetical protein